MDPEIQYDERPGKRSEETLDVPQEYDDEPHQIKEIKSEISPSSTTPNQMNPPISPSENQILHTSKRQRSIRDKDIYFAIKWACGILTVAASVVFGIWAPLSYEATISDNDTQNTMVAVLSNAKNLASTANVIASNALDTASAQHEAIGSLYSTIGLMGQLAVMEFCYGQQVAFPTTLGLHF